MAASADNAKRGRPRAPRSAVSYMLAASKKLESQIASSKPRTSVVKYREDPVAYASERLHLEYMPHQAAVAYAIAGQWHRITDEMRELAHLKNEGKRKVAVTSGTKTGKSALVIGLALWFYECFELSRTFMSAAKGDQIRTVLWRELDLVLKHAPHRPEGLKQEDPSRGFQSPDRTREIKGFTGRKIESLAGISGNLFLEIDEASFLEEDKAQAIEGNRSGEGDLGAPLLYTSNPTRTEGPFFDAFHSKQEYWTTAHFDSEEISAWAAKNRPDLKFVCSPNRIEEWKREWGADSPFYLVRVKGDFLRIETGRIISLHLIEAAHARWETISEDDELGVLSIGFDPAGENTQTTRRDEAGFCAVRGRKCLEVYAKRSASDGECLTILYAMLLKYRRGNEVPRVVVDAEGDIGARFVSLLRAEAERRRIQEPATAFSLHIVRAGSKHVRNPQNFAFVRDELWRNGAEWMLEGGLPQDYKLDAELHLPVWDMAQGKARASPKTYFRDQIGRSPDRADSLLLAVWQPRTLQEQIDDPLPGASAPSQDMYEGANVFGDVHSQNDPWWPSGGG